jgi:hypothetical protein
MIHLGANDAMMLTDPESWRPMLEQAIAWIRSSMAIRHFP